MAFEGLRVVGKKGIDQSKQLHHSLVLPQVFVAFEKEHEVLTVATCVCVYSTCVPAVVAQTCINATVPV